MVVEVGVEMRVRVLPRGEQASFAPGGGAQRVHRGDREPRPRRLVERPRGAREAGDRERVPGRQDLVVESGSHPFRPRREQNRLRPLEPRSRIGDRQRERRRDLVEGNRHAQVPRMALEIGRAIEPPMGCRDREILGPEQRADLVARPDVEFAFLAIAVGVEAREERAVGSAHFARHPGDDAARDCGVPGLARHPREVRVQAEEGPVVVEHLLEMRDRPLGVHAVAAEASAELVVNAPVGHPRERHANDRHRFVVALAQCRAQAQHEIGRMRELGRGPEAAVVRVETPLQSGQRQRRRRRRQRALVRRSGLETRERVLQPRGLLGDRLALLPIRGGDPRQQVEESRQPVTALARKIRAAEEGRTLRREEHRERPAPRAARHQRMRHLIDLVKVRTLLAVDLDVDEVRVHGRRDGRVLERLVRHHVAPVARRVADGEQDRLAFAPRESERFLAPGMPIDGVARVLQQVRARFSRKAIGHGANLGMGPRRGAMSAAGPPQHRALQSASGGSAAAESPNEAASVGLSKPFLRKRCARNRRRGG